MISALFLGSVVPALFAGAFILVAGFMPAFVAGPLRRASFPIGFAVGFYLLNKLPNWPPTGSTNSLFFVALLCFVWSFIDIASLKFSKILRIALFALVIFMVLKPLLLEDRLGESFPAMISQMGLSMNVLMLMQILILIILGLFGWWLFQRGAITVAAPVIALLPILIMTGLSFAMLFSGSALSAQLAGAYCAVHAALLVMGLISPKFFKFQEHQIFSIVLLFAMSLIAFYFLDLSLLSMALLLSPLLLFLVWAHLPLKPKTTIGQMILMSLLAAIPIGIAVYPIFQAYGTGY